MITAGPRQDQVLWDHTLNPKAFGSGASGSGWSVRSDFWYGGDPDNRMNSGDYATMSSDGLVRDGDDGSMRSVSHHDLWLSEGEIFARLVKVAESPPNPILRVDFKFQVTAQRPLILTQDHISVDDLDTRDVNDNVDASRIKFRITGLTGGALQRRSSSSASDWEDIVADGAYPEFTLADLQGGLVAFVPDASASTLAFDIQAHDGTHLSDSDRSTSVSDPESVSVSVVARKEINAGKEMPVNDDRRATSGDGALTPSSATLDAWISAAASNPRVLVRIEGTKRGETLFLEDGHDIASIASITSSWSWDDSTGVGILSLQSDGSATPDDFQTVLNALVLRTVRFPSASIRTISVRPDIAAEVPQKDYYARDVLIRESGPRPYIGERKTAFLKFGQDDRAILSPSEFLVEDFDTSASDVTIVMRELSAGATLQKRNAVSGVYRDIEPESDGSLEFTLKELQEGLMAIHLASPLGKKVSFELEARDSDGNWNDVGKSNSKSNTDQRGVRSFSLTSVLLLPPEKLEVDPQTGYQRAVPFGGLEKMIEEARSSTDGTGALSIEIRNAVSGDRLLMRKSFEDIGGGLERERTSLYAHGVRWEHHECGDSGSIGGDLLSSERVRRGKGTGACRALGRWHERGDGFVHRVACQSSACFAQLGHCCAVSRYHACTRWSGDPFGFGVSSVPGVHARGLGQRRRTWCVWRSFLRTRREACSLRTSGSFYRRSCWVSCKCKILCCGSCAVPTRRLVLWCWSRRTEGRRYLRSS